MKKTTLTIGWAAMVAVVILSGLVAVFASCEQGTGFNGTEIAANASRQAAEVKAYPTGIVGYVYARNATGEASTWTDYAFKDAGTVIIQDVTPSSNSSNSATYTYTASTGVVTIASRIFYISDDGGLTMEDEEGNVYDNLSPVGTPPTFTAVPDDLTGTVFTGPGPRTPDWVTFTFRDATTVVASFTTDNTTNVWTYAYRYDSGNGSGTITANPGQTSPGDFTITIGSPGVMVFDNFFGHAENYPFNRWQ